MNFGDEVWTALKRAFSTRNPELDELTRRVDLRTAEMRLTREGIDRAVETLTEGKGE